MKREDMVDHIRMSLPWMNTTFATKVLDVIESKGMKMVREEVEQHCDGVKYVKVEGWDE